MNEFKTRLLTMEQNQRTLLRETQELLKEYESSDLIHENEKLRRETEEDRRKLNELRIEAAKLKQENSDLRLSLSEQILDEKLNILRLSNRKLETYFASEDVMRKNRLRQFEEKTRERIHKMMTASRKLTDQEQAEFATRLDNLSQHLERSLEYQRSVQEQENRRTLGPLNDEYKGMTEEGVDEATIQRRIRQNRLEMKIGLNWINKIAIVLILIAVGLAFGYGYSNWFNDYTKGTVFFVFGALLLGAGEFSYRKNRRTFALGLLGGGTAVLYGSVFYSYFLLGIIGMFTALGLSVLITVVTLLLSLRYESQTISALALIGGYLPLLSFALAFGLEGTFLYAAMGYLFLLNLLLLLVSLHKRWIFIAYLSFVLNTPSMILLVWLADSRWVGAAYAFLTFLMYLGSTLAYPMRFKQKLKEWDVVLLAINTLVGCGVMYALLESAGAIEFRGLLALLFGLLYFGLGRLTEKFVPAEKNTRLLFDLTALVFAILIVPFQLGWEWSAMGWLAEALVLCIYGSRSGSKMLERAGWAVWGLCVLAFVLVDLPQHSLSLLVIDASPYTFMVKYTLITIGTLALAAFYIWEWKNSASRTDSADLEQTQAPRMRYSAEERSLLRIIRYVAIGNTWIYALYEAFYVYDLLRFPSDLHYLFYKMLLAAGVTALLSWAVTRFPSIQDRVIRVYAQIQYAVGCLIGIALMFTSPVLKSEWSENTLADYVALFVLLAVNILIFWSVSRRVQKAVRRYPQNGEWYPVGIALYGLVMVSALLGVQLHIHNAGITYSVVYLLVALACIVYGFRRRYVYIRRMGLILTLLCTAKLLVFDLGLSGAGSRIIAFFVAGFILLGISYMYQRVSNRLEEEEAAGKENSNADNQQ
ncbi:DUF2339 domain-containing protein [Saccharibacillus sp. JS10]|uniref:DUF2339 domain-containing protein n=1 Tax=Saccharibacillus sp. JS10 TaxID=2950552 RepID=UPI0021091A07|nr:DUF2339 domain-containing protein [Saccharibacillus sp. JS10]MCQ4087966.1 DUF2339 domain-containing protein [Saccharibacillus sp. JS10]